MEAENAFRNVVGRKLEVENNRREKVRNGDFNRDGHQIIIVILIVITKGLLRVYILVIVFEIDNLSDKNGINNLCQKLFR